LRGKFISYLRVSTDKQGRTGYGINAQRKAVTDYLNGGSWELVAECVEVESGRRTDNRPELQRALALCKKHRAKLVIAKLDRLSRNVAFIANLMDGKVDFVCCDMPEATRLTIHVLAAVAEHEREMISARTKAGLAAAKAKGIRLGNPALAAANEAAAMKRAKELKPVLKELRGLSARAAAAAMNERNIGTATGVAKWSAKTVIRARERLGL
jgi:DNA invertase Pin-like site-specific DNA recombinase